MAGKQTPVSARQCTVKKPMANLAHAIHGFQSGGLSPKEFFAQVDRVLATDQANSARQLEQILSDEQTRILLPPDVYAELQRRADGLTELKPQAASGEETRLQTGGERSVPPSMRWTAGSERANAEPERIKGVGDTLNGRFVLEECIGFGGMGTVYKALDLRKLEASDRNPYIAIKVLNVQFRGHPKSLIALQREARKAQKLAHPNIVSVYDFDRDGAMVYLTMEYLCGSPLSRTLRMPNFAGMPFAEALPIITGIGKALAYAHDRGFVHCDLKPANVFLTDSGEVKVIDFGIARVFHKPEEDVEATVFDAGSLGGLTPAYASPEMLEHREPDPRDDIYALACITYELLTGHHPFGRLSALQAQSAGMKPQRPKNLGLRQWRALQAALSFERTLRTPSVAAFLQQMSGQLPAGVTLAVAAASVLLVTFLAGIASYYWNARQGQRQPEAATATAEPAAPARPEPAETPPAKATALAPAPVLSLAAVAPVLAGVPCSALSPSIQGHALQVQGYLPKSFGSARLQGLLNAVPGVETLKLDVQQVSDDKCSVLKTFAPYWSRNRQAGSAASIHTKGASNGQLTEGTPLIVDITTPAYDSFVHVDYYVLDGHVVHMLPSPRAQAHQAPPNYTATIGSLGNWVVSKPFGTELIVLLVSPVPLFDTLRPESESRADYLQAVEKRLGQIVSKYGSDKIVADFIQITTRARKP
jgi:eukaryotic-like serine/threonine-protein kinase